MELEHQKYEKMVLQLGCLMQTGIDGYEIYKNVGVMRTLIFADGALGAKNAPHCGHKQYFEEGMERTNSDRNGQKSEKNKSNDTKCSYRGRLGVKKVEFSITSA